MFFRVVLCALGLALAQASGSTAIASGQKASTLDDANAAAKNLFHQAEEAFRAEEYERALGLYRRAYVLSPRVGFRFNLGQCYRKLGDCSAAIAEFKAYVAESKSSAGKQVAQELIAECEDTLIDEAQSRRVENALTSAGAARSSANGAAGLSPAYFWSGVGLTTALLAGTIVTGVIALNKDAQLDDPNTPREDLPDLEDSRDTFFLTAGILLGSTVVVGAGTTVLYFFTDWGGEARQISFAPRREGGGMIVWSGHF